MSDVFTSYSRRDLPFVVRLLEALKGRDVEAWVDLEGLYAGEEYWPEICKAIEAADVFLWVISPDAVSSVPCQRELQHAVDHNKHIVPILFREVEADRLHPELAKRQWMFFRDGDDFETAVAGLVAAIRTDPAWTRMHTRLLIRAREWQGKRRDGALTLRGRDLREAERWLASSAEQENQPTALHEEYIESSRKATRRRRLLLVSAATVAIAVAGGLWWVSLGRQVGQLNNVGAYDLLEGNVESAIEKLERAAEICAGMPFPATICTREVLFNLADAYHEKGSYAQVVDLLSEALESGGDRAPAEFLYRAHQNLAVAHILLAEQMDAREDRLAAYDRAEEQTTLARRLGPPEADPTSVGFDITRARIHIGRDEWPQAIEILERVRTVAAGTPDPYLLLAAAHDCSGQMLESIEALQAYFSKLPQSNKDPHWRKNRQYYERITERCKNS